MAQILQATDFGGGSPELLHHDQCREWSDLASREIGPIGVLWSYWAAINTVARRPSNWSQPIWATWVGTSCPTR